MLAAALSGANIVYESAGMYASLLGTCPESLLLDNDVLGTTLRYVRGIEVNEETLSFDNIKEVCLGGEGHYLGSDRTLGVMQSEYIYPQFSDRSSPLQWEENEKPVLLEQAIKKRNELLSSYFPQHISDAADLEVRKRFPIKLSREAIGRNQ